MAEKPKPIQEAANVDRDQYRLCPSCGNFAGFKENQVYCILCGTALIDKCPGCDEPIVYPTARFCPSCGTQMVASRGT